MQAAAPTPDENPQGNTGAFKSQVTTGGSYDIHSGNASRIVNDLKVPGALGAYGLDFTRYWNSLHPTDTNFDAEWPLDFGMSGWSHSWKWTAVYGEERPDFEPGVGVGIWTTSITITFPDGHATKFKIVRDNGPNGHHDPRCGPQYLPAHDEINWPTPGLAVHDNLVDMAPDGSQFWLNRADGGSVHFVGVTSQYVNGYAWWYYEAREIFDPHGLCTELSYNANGNLTQVKQREGNRWLTLTWGMFQGSAASVITRVDTGGDAGSQYVEYKYSLFPNSLGNMLTLIRAYYPNEPAPGQTAYAAYTYSTSYNDGGGQSTFPLLKTAKDPHYAGAMTKISYNYYGQVCPTLNVPIPRPHDFGAWFYFTPDAIAEEKNPETTKVVARFAAECHTGGRKDYNGIGGWRILSFGISASDPDMQNSFGYDLTRETDFVQKDTYPPNWVFRKQNGAQPTKVWDGRGILTQMANLDDSGSPSEVHYRDGSNSFYDRINPGNSAAPDLNRIHNQQRHWLFKKTDELNNVTVYRRDERRRVTDISYYNDANVLVASESYTYNEWNQVTSHTLPSNTGDHPAVAYYQYNALHQLELEYNTVEGYNERKEYFYDGLERVERIRDGRARADNALYTTKMEYNGRHQVIKTHYRPTGGSSDPTVSYEYDMYGNRTAVIDELGHRKDYTYDSYRRQTSCTEQVNSCGVGNRTWNWIYDRVIDNVVGSENTFCASTHTSKDWRIQIEPEFNANHDRRATARTFDFNNRITSEQTGLVQHSTESLGTLHTVDGVTGLQRFTYDENGQKQTSTDALLRVTTYGYNNRNRLETTTEPKRASQPTNPVTRFDYDVAGNKKKVTFPDTKTQRWENYDPFGQAWQFFDERNNPTDLIYQWGPMKKLLTVKTYRERDNPPGGTETQETDFEYDGIGRPLKTTFPDTSTEVTTYKFGQIETYKTRRGQKKIIDVSDARGRENHHYWLNYLNAPDGTTPAVTSLWDDAGRLTNISNVFSTIDYTYDDAGLVITEGSTVAGSGVAGGGTRKQLTYCRYPSGEVSQITYPNGSVVNRNYTARGQLEGVGWGAGSTSYAYLADGKVDYQAWTNNVWTKFEYDGRGMISSVRHKNTDINRDLAYREYWRDDRDRILAWKRGGPGGGSPNGMEDGRGNRYGYDEEGQLISASYRAENPAMAATGAMRADVFEYDKMGNRMGTHDLAGRGATNFTRDNNGLNQYSSWTPSVIKQDDDMGGEWGSPGHANGVTMQEGWITASFNALNQPMAMWCPTYGSSFLWFGYDPLGRCVKRWMGSDTGNAPNSNPATYFYYDGQNLVQEGSSANIATRIYVHGGRVDEIVASQVSTGEWRYHHYDGQGHCIMLTDASGVIREQYDYDAFGMPYFYSASGGRLGGSAQWGNRFLFTGREWLGDLRIYDYRARQYQPELGRFLQPDPKEFEAGDYNLYRYCHNDPVNKSDPTGLQPEAVVEVKAEVERRVTTIESRIPHWVKVGTLTAQFKGVTWQQAAHSAARMAATMAKNTASEHYGIVVHLKNSNVFYGTNPIPSGMKGQFYGGSAQASDLADLRVRGYERAAGYWSVAGRMDLGKNGWPTRPNGTNDLDTVKGHMNAVLAIPGYKSSQHAGETTFREHSGERFGPEWDDHGNERH